MSRASIQEERRMALHDLMDRLQWRLLTGPGIYRLERLPSRAVLGRGLPRFHSSMDYACLCWVLWFAEHRSASTQDWFVLSELAPEITRVAGGLFSLAERAHRESLVRALQFLVDLGVLIYRDGDAEGWVSGQSAHGEGPDVLYDFAESAPRLLANFDYAGLSRLAGAQPGQRQLPETGEDAAPLARAWRALALGPVFWQGDDPDAFAALRQEADRVRADLEQALGWELELGEHYARIWRTTTARQAAGVLIDLVPDPGEVTPDRHTRYIYHPIVLLIGAVRREVESGRLQADADGAVSLTGGALHDLLADLHRRYRQNWGAELSSLSLADLAGRVLQEMRLMGYLRGPDALDRCCLLPVAALAIGEYAPTRTDRTANGAAGGAGRPRRAGGHPVGAGGAGRPGDGPGPGAAAAGRRGAAGRLRRPGHGGSTRL